MRKDLKKEFDKELRDIGKKENLRASDEFKNKIMKVLNELPERNNVRKKKNIKSYWIFINWCFNTRKCF